MINCQITQDGKIKDQVVQMSGLVFRDNHGIQRSNYIETSIVEASLNEWHYDKFGIMRQHFHGKEDNAGFQVMHEVRPALMFSIATKGFGTPISSRHPSAHSGGWTTLGLRLSQPLLHGLQAKVWNEPSGI